MSVELEAILFEAMNAPYGVEVESNKPEQLRQKLYAIRRKNPMFEELAFVISPTKPETHVWVIKKPEPSNGQIEE